MLTDFHTHILPNIDDGSSSVAESMGMLQKEGEQGVTCVVATPHFYPRNDTPERFLKRREEAERLLRTEMRHHPVPLPEIKLGAEVLFFPGMSDSELVLQLTIDKKSSILIEMPVCHWTDRMYRELEDIYAKHGIVPVIAHVDRYIGPLGTHGIPQRLAQLPVMVQANAGFFIRPTTRAMALRMLRNSQIHVLGSDCHNLTKRVPNLNSAEQVILRSLGTPALKWIQDNEKKILSFSGI